jgi:2-haloalkanoic acid dehalogenase type II
MVKGILFDFWGTLVENGIYSPVKQVKSILRLRIPFVDYILKFEKAFMTSEFDSLSDAFKNVTKAFNINPPPFVIEKLVGMWNKNTLLSKPFPETIEVLKDLKEKGYKLAILSNTDQFSINQVLEKHNLRELFDEVFLSYNHGLLKTDTEFFEEAITQLGLSKEEVIMVGDSMESDIAGAEKAGIRAVLIDRMDKREYPNKITSLDQLSNIVEGGDKDE